MPRPRRAACLAAMAAGLCLGGAGAQAAAEAPAAPVPAAPADEKAARAEAIRSTLAAIQAEAAAQGGWDAWYARIKPLQEDFARILPGKWPWPARQDYVFYGRSLQYLMMEGWDKHPEGQDPAAAIRHLDRQLKARGIDLILMPIPDKISIYPDYLSEKAPADRRVFVQAKQLLGRLAQEDVEVIDLYTMFYNYRREQGEGAPLYYVRDGHWRNRGARLAGEQIAARLKRYGFVQRALAAPSPYETRPGARTDGVKADDDLLQVVLKDGGKFYTDAGGSPIVLTGDSFSMYNMGNGAMLTAQVARHIHMPLTYVCREGLAQDMPAELANREARGGFLKGRRVVVWTVRGRCLAEKGWQAVDLVGQPAPAAAGPVLGGVAATGRVADLSDPPPKDPPYPHYIMLLYVKELKDGKGAPIGEGDGVVRVLAMRDRRHLPIAAVKKGDTLSMRLTSWSPVKGRYEKIMAGVLADVPVATRRPEYWAEVGGEGGSAPGPPPGATDQGPPPASGPEPAPTKPDPGAAPGAAAPAAPSSIALPPVGGDEVDRLLKAANPPARFKDRPADFRVQEVPFAWWDWDYSNPDRSTRGLKPYKGAKRAIFDGARLIGFIDDHNAVVVNVRLFSLKPDSPVLDLVKPDDWSPYYMRNWGDALTMTSYWAKPDRRTVEVRGGGRTIAFVLTETFVPDGSDPGRDETAVQTAVLRLHPQLGYVLDHHMDWRGNRNTAPDGKGGRRPITISGTDLWGLGIVNPWPGEQPHDHGFFTPGKTYRVSDSPFVVFMMNGPAVEEIRHGWHPVVRRDGLLGYVGGRDGWGVALTVFGSAEDVKCGVCPAWGEFHLGGWDLPNEPDPDGFYRVRYSRRLVGLPPEVQDHIRAHSKVLFEGRRCLMIRLDGEDFEGQPLSLAYPGRAQRFGSGRGVAVTAERAHSGAQSIVARGITPDRLTRDLLYNEHPQARFDLNTKYRVECWVYVEGADTEGFVIARLTDPANYLKPESIGPYRTDAAKAGEGWKKVSMEFVSEPHGGALFLGFVALGPGRAFFDDFRIAKASAWQPVASKP